MYWSLYSNGQLTGLEGTSQIQSSFNLIAQGVDTAGAQIVKPYRPKYTTTDAEFNLQRQARKLTQVLDGQLLDKDCDAKMAELFTSAAVTGIGHLFGYVTEDGEIHVENCLPGSILVDPRDGQRGDPYEIHYRVPVARDVLYEMFPRKEAIIEKAGAPSATDRTDLGLHRDSTVDDVLVIYSFRRPSSKTSKDGRFVISTSEGALLDTSWDEPLPFVSYRWKNRAGSYFGIGLGEAGMLSQARYLRYEARVEVLESGPARWITNDSRNKVRVEKLTNEDYAFVHFTGAEGAGPPVVESHQVTPVDLVGQQDRVREQFLAEQGISQLQAQGTKPAGLNSAVSQRTYQEITAVRQKQQAAGFQRAYVQLFELLVRLNRRAAELKDEDYTVQARTTRGRIPMVSEIAWADVDLPENKYRVECQPISDVATSAAGREELVSEWIASGMTSRNFAQNLTLQSSLDTDATSRLELCDMDRTAYDIERIEDGFLVAPDPYVRGDVAADLARRAYVHRSCQDVPSDVLKALRKYVDDCVALKNTQAPPPPEPQVPPAGAPPSNPPSV